MKQWNSRGHSSSWYFHRLSSWIQIFWKKNKNKFVFWIFPNLPLWATGLYVHISIYIYLIIIFYRMTITYLLTSLILLGLFILKSTNTLSIIRVEPNSKLNVEEGGSFTIRWSTFGLVCFCWLVESRDLSQAERTKNTLATSFI